MPLLARCGFEDAGSKQQAGKAAVYYEFEEKIYSDATLEDRFVEDKVAIVLKKSASIAGRIKQMARSEEYLEQLLFASTFASEQDA